MIEFFFSKFYSFHYFEGNVHIVNVLLEAGASVNLLSHVSHTWPDVNLFETVEPSIVTAARLGKKISHWSEPEYNNVCA